MIIEDETFQLYKEYVGFDSKENLERHLSKMRLQLLQHGPPFRCIDTFRFSTPRIRPRFYYSKILEDGQTQSDPLLIDIGCCAGTDLRQLFVDGYPGHALMGVDQSQHYINCGYDLFEDHNHCPIQFVTGDMFTMNLPPKPASVIMTNSLIHLLTSEAQVRALVGRIVQWLRPGGLFVGCHVALPCTGTIERHHTLKYYFGKEDLHRLLQAFHFEHIQMECTPHNDHQPNSPTFWLSFCATYSPPSPSTMS
ncbi:S-adenosyl-L-methionine-dependent methyltransferase [Hesseltinella vesiculosa]|uniref:S-adenosyl-L-methionine-dependent methyltransferase n=1 Tax=Hesseltinella vesiculosa TaxID=101127 RepID=A0A1X2GKS8_9FUNG|nr:S-adenosyl-L-methionine-dependent methyltransferase [Hesseltinella vesiculosa]